MIAVAARNLKSAEDFAAKFDIKKAYGSYKELANDPYVEVVYVGSINTAHLEICKMLLNHDKHVLCEKPLGMNVKETEEMLKLAQKKKLFFMEAIWSRYVEKKNMYCVTEIEGISRFEALYIWIIFQGTTFIFETKRRNRSRIYW